MSHPVHPYKGRPVISPLLLSVATRMDRCIIALAPPPPSAVLSSFPALFSVFNPATNVMFRSFFRLRVDDSPVPIVLASSVWIESNGESNTQSKRTIVVDLPAIASTMYPPVLFVVCLTPAFYAIVFPAELRRFDQSIPSSFFVVLLRSGRVLLGPAAPFFHRPIDSSGAKRWRRPSGSLPNASVQKEKEHPPSIGIPQVQKHRHPMTVFHVDVRRRRPRFNLKCRLFMARLR
uniref:Neur_chan_memb domain-containing protein n=1 Tax=Panagrellus redivivus TaxID=6233 RepID=A0A7E4W484_PANRE